jgi:hypothetical protein
MSSRATTAALIDTESERILGLGCGQGLLAAMSAGTPFANIMLIARPHGNAAHIAPHD